jgi:hypothetical protein
MRQRESARRQAGLRGRRITTITSLATLRAVSRRRTTVINGLARPGQYVAPATNDARCGVTFADGESPNFDAYRAKKGKLLMYNGTADLAFSIIDVKSYYRKREARYGTSSTANFRAPSLCLAPTSSTHSVRWQSGWSKALRDTIVSTARAAAGVAWPSRTRPHCAYPKQSIYEGTGSIEDALNFNCL